MIRKLFTRWCQKSCRPMFTVLEREMQGKVQALEQRAKTAIAESFTKFAEDFIKKHGNIVGVEGSIASTGYIVILGRVDQRDVVRIVPVYKDMNTATYNTLVRWIEQYLGYSVNFSDVPPSALKPLPKNIQ